MLIISDGKNIDTVAFKNLFVQGEKLSEQIVFRIPRYYNARDLLPSMFTIKGVNEKNETAEQVLVISQLSSSYIDLEWNVTSMFTAAAGKLNLEIQAAASKDGAFDYILKYILPPVYVRETLNGSTNIPVPDVSEQIINEINAAAAEGLSSINQAIESFDTTAVENRLDNAEAAMRILNSEIKIKVMSFSEYNSEAHSDNILYVII